MKPQRERRSTVLATNLLRNRRGNIAVILALFFTVMAVLVGSGLDISRAYLAKTRLSQACDAGVLAGRKMMGTSTTLTQGVTAEVQKYVNFNFPQGSFSTTAFSITPAASNGSLQLTLSTSVNTSLMKLFGKNSVSISVTCSSTSTYNNIDLVLVLDTTGSMACSPSRDTNSCSSYVGSNGTSTTISGKTVSYVREETNGSTNISRIQSLRDALTSLKTTLSTTETQFAAMPSASRKRIRYGFVPFSQMVNAGFSTNSAGTTLYSRQPSWFRFAAGYAGTTTVRKCFLFFCWDEVQSTTIVPATWASSTWDGCVEERGTTNTITSATSFVIGLSLPGTAYDLSISVLPSSATPATQWLAADPTSRSGAQYACPAAMSELQEMSNTAFSNKYAASNGFLPSGATYLDIGMLWAERLLSRSGPWATDNPATYNGSPVSRYVIFMTDGEMDTGNSNYGAYGVEQSDMRITSDGSASTADANHSKRLDMICDALKADGVKIYTIAFSAGSSLSTDLTDCASDASSAFAASDGPALAATFGKIATQIGSLRLDQ